jgi:hypothetical protein
MPGGSPARKSQARSQQKPRCRVGKANIDAAKSQPESQEKPIKAKAPAIAARRSREMS